MGIWYATREDVLNALESAETARSRAQVDRLIGAASRAVDGQLHRRFYPWTGTRYKDWPNDQYSRPWRLWLDQDEVISVDTLTAGGVTIPSPDYNLEPANNGPPFTHIEIDLDSSAAFSSGATHQRAIAITGTFGYSADEEPAGLLAEALDASETAVDVTDSAAIGVGTIIKADSERMIVTGKTMLDTGQDLAADLAAQQNDVTVSVASGAAFAVDETILVDAERMHVVDIAGNNLIVKRAVDGSVLAAHTTPADVYAPRTLTVTRGALGTAAATHSTAAAVTRHVVPSLVNELCIAETINALSQERSGYAREVGVGETSREASGRGIRDVRREARIAHGRRARKRAV